MEQNERETEPVTEQVGDPSAPHGAVDWPACFTGETGTVIAAALKEAPKAWAAGMDAMFGAKTNWPTKTFGKLTAEQRRGWNAVGLIIAKRGNQALLM